jgi:hypothetical protein
MMPIRKDIVADVQKVFPKDWMADVFATSIKQLQLNGDTTGPLLREYTDVGKIYLDAWYDIVVGKNYGRGGKIDRGYIRERLNSTYVPQMKEVLGKQYPD